MRDINFVYRGYLFWVCFIGLFIGGSLVLVFDVVGVVFDVGRTIEWVVFVWGVEVIFLDRLEGVVGIFLFKIFDLMIIFVGFFILEVNMFFKEICYKVYKFRLYIFKIKIYEKFVY